MKIELELPDELSFWLNFNAEREGLPIRDYILKEFAQSVCCILETLTMGDNPMTPLEAVNFIEARTPNIKKILETLTEEKVMLWHMAKCERDQELKGLTFRDPERIR